MTTKATTNPTATRAMVAAMLQRLSAQADQSAPELAAALKHWFPGQDAENLACFLDFAGHLGSPDEPVWTEFFNKTQANGEAAQKIKLAASEKGYSDTAFELVKQQKEQREAGQVAIWDYVLALKTLRKDRPLRHYRDHFIEYAGGTWNELDERSLRPSALEVLVHKHKTSRTVSEVIDTLADDPEVRWLGKLHSAVCFTQDRQAVLINCESDVLKVSADRIEKLEHSPDYNFAHKLAGDYDPDAQCRLFEDAVDVSLLDPADQAKLRWLSGWMLYPENPFKISPIALGRSGTRKTTILDSGLGSVFKEGETRTDLSLAQICEKNGYYLPDALKGMVNFSGELSALELEDSGIFKTVAAGERIQVREIRGKPYWAVNYSTKFVFLANHPPRFKHGSDAEYTRLEFLAFNNPVTPEADDKEYRRKVSLEATGIFSRWMVPALQGLLRGEKLPAGSAASIALRATFRDDNDVVNAFARECLDCDPEANQDGTLSRQEAEDAMSAFCEDHGYSDKLVKSIWKQLQAKCGLKLVRPVSSRKDGPKRWLPRVLQGAKLKEGCRRTPYQSDDGRRNWGVE